MLKWMLGCASATALAVCCSVLPAAPAMADPVQDYVDAYGATAVCGRLDQAGTVTPQVLRAIGRYLNSQGFSDHDAAGIVWNSVTLWCPKYQLAVRAVTQFG